MVIGNNVTTVQRVSNYCLKQDAEVFPYYYIPTLEEITLFAPHVLILCLPISNKFQHEVPQPYILWSEQPMNDRPPLATTFTELSACLQKFL
ncbi:hypothetical protein WKK05_08825 [Nostoc sp. UHCC 0302]